MAKRKGRKEALSPEFDVWTHQPVNDIIPYFSFKTAARVHTAKQLKKPETKDKWTFDNFYAGFCLPESMYVERIGDEHVFFWQDTYLFVPAELLQFVDHEGNRYDT